MAEDLSVQAPRPTADEDTPVEAIAAAREPAAADAARDAPEAALPEGGEALDGPRQSAAPELEASEAAFLEDSEGREGPRQGDAPELETSEAAFLEVSEAPEGPRQGEAPEAAGTLEKGPAAGGDAGECPRSRLDAGKESSPPEGGSGAGRVYEIFDIGDLPGAMGEDEVPGLERVITTTWPSCTIKGEVIDDGVTWYVLQVVDGKDERWYKRRYNDFKKLDTALRKLGGRFAALPALPTAGVVGLRHRLHVGQFERDRRAGLQAFIDAVLFQVGSLDENVDIAELIGVYALGRMK